jgi:tRNA nucleotidyltransferase (CCA-adding enzyme)
MTARYFKVGGYVRDWKMGQVAQDVDYVVTGVTESQFLQSRPFGRSFTKIEAQNFPVYHDQDGNEWALARRERKEGTGYHGFSVDFGPEVTIINGKEVRTINPELLKKFMDAGFDPDTEYSVDELIQFFRHITL